MTGEMMQVCGKIRDCRLSHEYKRPIKQCGDKLEKNLRIQYLKTAIRRYRLTTGPSVSAPLHVYSVSQAVAQWSNAWWHLKSEDQRIKTSCWECVVLV